MKSGGGLLCFNKILVAWVGMASLGYVSCLYFNVEFS